MKISLKLAKNNRVELEKVLTHYSSDPADSLKLKAAKFLIAGMINKHYKDGRALDELHIFIDSIFQIKIQEELLSLPVNYVASNLEDFKKTAKNQHEKLEVYPDLEYIGSGYLIRNIDMAFEAWEKPWARHVSFDDFCEFILPYRIRDEIPEDWRSLYIERFSKVLEDSMPTTPKEAGRLINNVIRSYPVYITDTKISPVHIRPSLLLDMKFGFCEDYVSLSVLAMRALGVPAVVENIPGLGGSNLQHTLGAILDVDGSPLDFNTDDEVPGEHLRRYGNLPKIYRQTFQIQKNSLALIRGNEEVPGLFRDPCMVDVTYNYSKTIDLASIEVNIPHGLSNNKFVYLCIFDNTGWRPVAWSKVKNRKAHFDNFSDKFIYQVGYYENDRIMPVDYPFMFDSTGTVGYIIPDTTKLQDMYLERKYRDWRLITEIVKWMVDGRIEAADNRDFKNEITLYTLDSTLDCKYRTIEVDPGRPYQYYRYISSDSSSGMLAELEFYDKQTSKKLTGEVFGTRNANIYYPDSKPENVFDNDPLTFFSAGQYASEAGIRLREPSEVDKVRLIVRNDDNGIRKGNSYELFYGGDRGWVSAGRQIATEDDLIVFKGVPTNGLYWLRNYTRGREERVFMFKDGKPIWY